MVDQRDADGLVAVAERHGRGIEGREAEETLHVVAEPVRLGRDAQEALVELAIAVLVENSGGAGVKASPLAGAMFRAWRDWVNP